MLKKFLVFTFVALSSVSFSRLFAQESASNLVGKPLDAPEVQSFISPLALDAATGISFENGVQAFHDGTTLYALYFFNNTNLNGQQMKAYSQPLPYGLSFRESMETLKKKLGSSPVAKGDHWVWKLGAVEVEIAFADAKKSEVSFVALSAVE